MGQRFPHGGFPERLFPQGAQALDAPLDAQAGHGLAAETARKRALRFVGHGVLLVGRWHPAVRSPGLRSVAAGDDPVPRGWRGEDNVRLADVKENSIVLTISIGNNYRNCLLQCAERSTKSNVSPAQSRSAGDSGVVASRFLPGCRSNTRRCAASDQASSRE